jgi:hypothetical protein
MDELLKKLFLDEKGKVSITKQAAIMIGIGVFIDGIPGAAAAKGIVINYPEWVKLLSFCFQHIGYTVGGIGVVDIVHKYLPKK